MSAAQLLSSITTIQWLSHVRVLVKSSPSEQGHWGWDCLGERESKWGGRYCKNGVVMRVQVDFYFEKSKGVFLKHLFKLVPLVQSIGFT